MLAVCYSENVFSFITVCYDGSDLWKRFRFSDHFQVTTEQHLSGCSFSLPPFPPTIERNFYYRNVLPFLVFSDGEVKGSL